MIAHFVGLWWVWLSAALAFAILETLLPGFVFLGFAIGAAIVSGLLFLQLSAGASLLFAVFAVASLVAWIVLKRTFRGPVGQPKYFTKDIND